MVGVCLLGVCVCVYVCVRVCVCVQDCVACSEGVRFSDLFLVLCSYCLVYRVFDFRDNNCRELKT